MKVIAKDPLDLVLSSVGSERIIQRVFKGYDAAHDDQHKHGELSLLAKAILDSLKTHSEIDCDPDNQLWIESVAEGISIKCDLRTALVKAAACIVADIERMDRAANIKEPPCT